ncbi:MAG TPA: hypothetical protein VFB33_13800 [Candidatus Binataceae bacterium]|nr:hypothetical protein [Candidatus Binataceae bacterium]
MKTLLKYGLAAAMVVATAMPAMARSWVVCVDTAKDARFSSETVAPSSTPLFFTAAAPIYPGGTDVSAAMNCASSGAGSVNATQVGTFFTLGSFVNGLPGSTAADLMDQFFVLWHFRIDGKGAFDTTGPTRSSATYPQTIIGSTNPGLVPTHGKATVTNLSNGTTGTTNTLITFKIRTPEGM